MDDPMESVRHEEQNAEIEREGKKVEHYKEDEPKIKSPYFPIDGGVISQEEITKALRVYVAVGILQKIMINGVENWKESDKFSKLSQEEKMEWVGKVQKQNSLKI